MRQVLVLLSHAESDISISNHHWNLRSVLKPSPTSLKSKDTLNIFRRTRGYPSVLRKVWPVYCSSQSWRFDSLRSDQDAGKYLLEQFLEVIYFTTEERNNAKNDQNSLENYFVCRWLFCLFERTVQIIKFYRGNFYGYSWAKDVKIA